MHGLRGTSRRRTIIAVEFVLGAVIGLAFGLWLVSRSVEPPSVLFACWILGIALNYVPLAVLAVRLSRHDNLAKELAGADIPREARRAGVFQLWILVPLAIVILALAQVLRGARQVG